MKRKTIFYLLCFFLAVGSIINSCQKDSVSEELQPITSVNTEGTVTTVNASSITENSATTGGNVTDDGGASITARGVCWSTSKNPTVTDSKTTNGTGKGSFTSDLSNLSPSTTYYVIAYATNSEGTAYGNQVEFTTIAGSASVITTDVNNVTENSATSGGNITDDGGDQITARGVCWSTSENPTVADSKTTDGSGTGSFTSELTDLSPFATYYVRAYVTNNVGTAYGNQVVFTTIAGSASVITVDASNITDNSATSGGNVTDDGGDQITARGVCWSTSENPTVADSKTTDGSGTGSFTSELTDLSPSATYYVRAYATNSAGTAYGNQVEFTTIVQLISAPTISAPSTSNGSFTVTMTYSWPSLPGVVPSGKYELEESTFSLTSGFQLIQSSYGIPSPVYEVDLTRNPGTYYYRARVYLTTIGAGGYSPYSEVILVTITVPSSDVRINNYINFPVSEIRTSTNGINWSESYGPIPAQEYDILTNVPQNSQIRIRTSYWSSYHDTWIDLKETDWNVTDVINVPDPWPGVIVSSIWAGSIGSPSTWRGYSGNNTTWEMEFYNNGTFRYRSAPPLGSFSSWTTESYSLTSSNSNGYSFNAGGQALHYHIENYIDYAIDEIWWPSEGLRMNRY